MKNTRLHGIRKEKRDKAVREFEFQHPGHTQKMIADAFGLKQSTISEILKEREKWKYLEY